MADSANMILKPLTQLNVGTCSTHLSIGVDGRGAAGRRLYPSMQRISTFDSLCSDIHLFVNTMHTDRKK